MPQDWPCDVFTLYPVKLLDKYTYDFAGVSGDYEVTVNGLNFTFKYAYCDNGGCSGKIKSLKTGQEEYLNLECNYNNDKFFALDCGIIFSDEYLFTKFSDNEYRANLCNGESYVYFNLDECSNCECTVKDSRPNGATDHKMNCIEYNGKIRCLSNIWLEFHAEEYDAEKCVGSNKP